MMRCSILTIIFTLYILHTPSVKTQPRPPISDNQDAGEPGYPKTSFQAPTVHPKVSVPVFESNSPGYHPTKGQDFRNDQSQYQTTRYQTLARNGDGMQAIVQKFLEDLNGMLVSAMRKITPPNATRSGLSGKESSGKESATGFEEEEEEEEVNEEMRRH
ncbi:uncharacterized protein LOC141855266 [Brevipalpus obovatus]|uniref:uncharacterized protein LOC141855266 n=1 Tax=Brevipalpus obovatus TaxID=246614 RepID=UPI003D9E0204